MKVSGFEWERKRVLVTGARGFKGAWTCEVLRALGATVWGAVHDRNYARSSACAVLELERKIELPKVDITNYEEVKHLTEKIRPHVVIHLAAIAAVPLALENPVRTFETNVLGTVHLLEALRHLQPEKGGGPEHWRGVEVIVIISTDHVFGDEVLPGGYVGHKESDPLGSGGIYEASKAAGELAAQSFAPQYLRWPAIPPVLVITRSANCFGPGDPVYRRVIPRFLKSALDHGRIDLTCRNNGRQFIDVRDAVAGYILAASKAPRLGQGLPHIFHFAIDQYRFDGSSRHWISIQQLASIIQSLVGNHVKIRDRDALDWAPNENKVQALNCDATRKQLGWFPRWDLRSGIEELRQWYLAADDAVRRKQIEDTVYALVTQLTDDRAKTAA